MEQLDQQDDASVLDEDVEMEHSRRVDEAPNADEVGAGALHVEAAAQEVLPSSSSTVAPPSLEVPHDSVPPAPVPPEPASSSSRLVGPRVHQTPFEHLEKLLPSRDFSILLDENAWRFRVECKVKGQVFEAPYHCKTFSKAFATALTWEAALKECHKYMWEKWALIENKAPNLSSERQEPGHVKEEVLKGLKPLMEKLSPKKDYARLR